MYTCTGTHEHPDQCNNFGPVAKYNTTGKTCWSPVDGAPAEPACNEGHWQCYVSFFSSHFSRTIRTKCAMGLPEVVSGI